MRLGLRRPPPRPDPLADAAEWTDPVWVALLLFRVPPTDRALAGWNPGYWRLPDVERPG